MVDPLLEIFSDVLGTDITDLSDGTAPENLPAWDSIANILLITEIEAKFKIELSTSDIESMTNIGRVRAALQRLGVAEIASAASCGQAVSHVAG
jgi:acyl carrier protein